mgnify:CR=1 FL=1
MKDNVIRMAVCPLCGRTYHGAPALSRTDNETLICPDCNGRMIPKVDEYSGHWYWKCEKCGKEILEEWKR